MRTLFILGLLYSASVFANVPAFTLVDKSYSFEVGQVLEAQNMPRIASQDGLGVCYACVAATMMQAENCRHTKPPEGCENLPTKELFSQLDLTRLVAPKAGDEVPTSRSSYEGLRLKPGDDGGDPHSTIIIAALYTKRVANEACVSLEEIVNKMTSRNESAQVQQALWLRLNGYYQKFQKNKACESCLAEIYSTAKEDISKNMNLNLSSDELLKAFALDSYEKFLDELTGAARCTKVEQSAFFRPHKKVTYEQFPKSLSGDRKKNEAEILNRMKEVLTDGRPVALTGVCLGEEDTNNCKLSNIHATIISGHKRVCDKKSESEPGAKCRDLVKVINCWGKSWQSQNNDGWVDAETLFRHTRIQARGVGWFKEKPKE